MQTASLGPFTVGRLALGAAFMGGRTPRAEAFRMLDPGREGLSPERVRRACDASLRRLGIDEIDVYLVNAPDPSVPLEDTLEALDGLVRAGKVRALGCSNFPAYLLAWAVALQDREGWAPFVCFQPQYSLVERSIELELLPTTRSAGGAGLTRDSR
jgi:aryl-alcohol dehydrogenase-like predicted oxidoreductase